MDKLKYIRVQNSDGSYTSNIPIAADAKNVSMNNGSDIQTVIGTINVTSDGNIAENLRNIKTQIRNLSDTKANLSDIGSPTASSTIAGMTDRNKIYIYTGHEQGYINGNWYYHDGTSWVSGGVYNSTALQTDKTLSVTDMAADAGAVGEQLMQIKSSMDNISIDVDDLGLYQDSDTGYVYLTYRGVASQNGIPLAPAGGGGGGGGDINNAILSVSNTSGWLSKTIAQGAECAISFSWSSLENGISTGNGSARITVNNIVRNVIEIRQGDVTIDIAPYLNVGSNTVKIRVSDIYDNGQTITFNIVVANFSISSTFVTTTPFTEEITFPFIPVGEAAKTVYFILDNVQIGTIQTTASNRQLSYKIPAQSHGSHTLKCYFEVTLGQETIRSNQLYFEFMFIQDGNNTPIITSSFNTESMPQYSTIALPFLVYTPATLTSNVTISANGTVVSTQTVDRTEQSFSYKANQYGTLTFVISTGNVSKTISLTITESEIDVKAETEDLALYLSSQGRSNAESTRNVWTYGEGASQIACTLSGFNWVSDGWQTDDDNATLLRVSGNARVTIPYKPFAQDFRTTGKTIELEFATRNVLDYDATILSCMSGGRGLELTPQKATLKSEQSEISVQYKENEHIRVTFVVEKRAENRLVFVFINSIPSGVIEYPTNDDFSQISPVNIAIGSNDATIDLYCIRVYDNDLTRHQVLDNWIADTIDGAEMLDRYSRNNVYDAYGNITIASLPNYIPYFILNADELPQYKGDKKTISGTYTDPMFPSKSFNFSGCQINVQGTSSAPYARKNYDMQFKQGFELSSGHADQYALRTGAIPFNRFVLKADVASSEGANNVELVRLYNDACPYKTPEMVADPRVRWGIDGFPIVVFWNDTATGTVKFLGKYNFNLPKRAPAPYGYADDETMESWEFQNNRDALMLFQSDYFNMEMRTDPDTGETKEAWRFDYEARFPSDEWTDINILQEFQTFVYSTWRQNATGDALASSVTYDGVTYTNDTAEYRLAKFKNEFPTYAELDSFIFYYIFTEQFLMVDSRAKNLFIGFNGSPVTVSGRKATRKATAQPYDMDTAIGTNNEGSLVNSYNVEDADYGGVYTGEGSVLWENVRDAFNTEIVQMYQSLRSQGILSFDTVETRFEEHQSIWPEAIWLEDSWFKYIDPLINPDAGKQPTSMYLPMMQGSKEQQRKWWLSNRFRYQDSRWHCGDALLSPIQLRAYSKGNITVTPYFDIYATVRYGTPIVTQRSTHGQATTLVCPPEVTTFYDTEIYIYSAQQIASVGDLSPLKVGLADFSGAINLQEVKLGDSSSSYNNDWLYQLSFGSNRLLKKIDVRNCAGLGDTTIEGHTQTSVDISGCEVIEEVYFDGTKVKSVTLPNGGILRVLQLPNTITSLVVRNQSQLETFSVTNNDYSNIETLRIENCSSVIPVMDILDDIKQGSRVRIIGFTTTATGSTDAEKMQSIEDFYDYLDTMRGLDEQGGNMDTAQVQGTITGIDSLTGTWLAQMKARYPYIDITYNHVTSYLYYYNGETLYHTETIRDGADGVYTGTPTKSSTAQYTYTFAGWSRDDDNTVDSDARTNVVADRNVYACYTQAVRTYTVRFYNGSTLLETDTGIPYGGSTTYDGSTPVDPSGQSLPFKSWQPAPTNIQGDTSCYAQFESPVVVEEIADSWDTIIANIDNGTYATKYKVGNYKPLDLGTEGTINMQIVAIDADELADGSYAPLTFIGMELLATTHRMNPGNSSGAIGTGGNGGWENCDMRSYLTSTILPLITTASATVASRLQRVKKVQSTVTDGTMITDGQTTTDDVWIPSNHEIFGTTSYETTGPVYTTIYNNATARTKYRSGSAYYWWLRSAYSTTYFRYVDNNGIGKNSSAPGTYGVALGFCLGLEPETITDSWSTILANTNPSASYSVGDTKMIDLGTEGKHLMEIVAFNTDDKADGTGKAKITWISKDLLNTLQKMNNSKTSSGDWEGSNLRSYLRSTIKPLIPSEVRSAIVEVTKGQHGTNGMVTNTDDVWIPSAYEISGSNYFENSGTSYSQAYPVGNAGNTKRIRNKGWWTRSVGLANQFYAVGSLGTLGATNPTDANGIALGFCTD